MPPAPFPRRALIEELEPRLLFSADFAPGIADALAPQSESRVLDASGEFSNTTNSQQQVQHARLEVVFIDLRVQDYDKILADIQAQNTDGHSIEVVLLDSERDGVVQIGEFLSQRQDVDAIHLISHGSAGSVQLGAGEFNFDSLLTNASTIKQWGNALSGEADILIYGCDLASTAEGQSLVNALAQLTGADVAASYDKTGAAELGGDWVLEYHTGVIQAQVVVSEYGLPGWQGVLATFTVTSTADTNTAGTLRYAINQANANGTGLDTINFNIAGTGIHTINLTSLLPDITGAVSINATTDDSYAANGNRPAIVLNGGGTIQDGLRLWTGSGGSTIRGLVIQNFAQDGIDISGSNSNTIAGNWIGLNAAGTGAAGNQQGINIWNSNNNIIGGSTAADRNVISANSGPGISINTDNGTGTGNQIRGNYIGTDSTGMNAVGNGNQGVYLNAANNTIGGTVAGYGNVISGTVNWAGIGLGMQASNTLIAGNLIGTNAAGTVALGNNGGGITVLSANNTIGGTTAAARNVISGNNGQGIRIAGASATGNVVIGNYIGTDITGTLDLDGTAQVNGKSGVVIDAGASNNRIGTNADGSNDAAERNVISGNNWFGVEMIGGSTSGNVVQGNYIGTNATGLVALGNSNGGVSFWGGSNNTLGSGLSGAGNVISGNGTGVLVASGATNNKVQGNIIGLGADGSTAIGNAGDGVYFYNGGSASATTGNLIGTDADGSNDTGERNVISGNVNGVVMEDAQVTGNIVAGNYIGTDATGALASGNTHDGVRLQAGANANTIGGSLAVQRNIISGNGEDGVQIDGEASNGNIVRGNWISINATGTATIKNAYDQIYISGGADNTLIGGALAGEGNWIAGGNAYMGIEIGGHSDNTVIQGNRIGTDLAGTANWGTQENGILIWSGATNSLVGGTTAGAGNIVAFSGQGGGVLTSGIAVADVTTNNIAILGNSIYGSNGLGIDLLRDNAVLANDAGDGDAGANNQQNFPVLSGATTNGTQITITGTFNSTASSYYRIEFFASTAKDGTGYGEGQRYLGYANVATDGSGNATINTTLTTSVTAGEYVSATATKSNIGYTTFTDTSEFAAVVTAVANIPVNTVPGAQSTNEDTALIFSTANGNPISISDADAGSNPLEVTLSVTNGTLTLSGVSGLTFASGDGTADATMTFRGTVTNINAALNGLSYVPTTNYNGSSTLTLKTTDNTLTSLNIDASLQGHYTFENTGALGTDTSPAAGYPGTAVNVTAVNDATRGNVIGLAGNGYIQTTGRFGNPANLTLAAWVNLTAPDSQAAEVISLGDSAILRIDESGQMRGIFYNGSAWVYTSYTVTLAGTGWHHVAYTFNDAGNAATVYLDGTSVASTSTTNSIAYTLGANSFIGKHGNGETTEDFNGKIDDARVYSRALSASEIATLAADLSLVDSDTVATTVTAVNDAPSGTNKTVTTQEDTTYTFTTADFGFSDVDGNALLAVKIATLPGAGSLTLSGTAVTAGQTVSAANISAGNLKFTPAANANGAGYASFTFQVQDNGGTANGGVDLDPTPNTMTINVTAVNDMPIANADSASGNEDTAITGNVLTNDTDADGNALTATLVAGPANGTLTLNPDGSFSYTPNANWSGTDSFQYLVNDGSGLVHYWGLDGNGTDSAGTANGTLTNGPITVAGHDGSTLQFDGVDDYVLLPDISYTNDFTLSFHFKVDDNTGTGLQYFYSHGAVGVNNSVHVSLAEAGWSDASVRNNLVTTVWDSNDFASGQVNTDISSLIGDGQWHLYTMTVKSGVGTQVYVDGALQGSIAKGGDAINPVGNAYFGARSDLLADRFLNAGTRMDSVSIFNRAFSASEVTGLAANSPQATATFTVNPVNDAPSGVTASLFSAIDEDNFSSAGKLVSDFTASTTDPDTGALKGIYIHSVDNSNGQWQYTLDGSNWSSIGAVSTSNALLLPADAVTRVRFVPNPDYNGTVFPFSIGAWDQTSGVAGGYADVNVTGGSTAFGAASTSVSITVNADNDAPSFGAGPGYVLGAPNDSSSTTTYQSDGKLLIVSTVNVSGQNHFAVTRYNVDGTVDTSFGSSGTAVAVIGTASTPNTVTVQSDGKILLAGGASGNAFAMARFNADGTLDSSFGSGGVVATNPAGFWFGSSYKAVVVQPDGKIIAGGHAGNGSGNWHIAVIRYNANGTVDTSWGSAGLVDFDLTPNYEYVTNMHLVEDGKLVVTGTYNFGSPMQFRLTSTGLLDTSFGPGSIGGVAFYAENGGPVVLDNDVQVTDPELSAANNFNGATLTLSRHGGANAQDVFSDSGTLSLSGGNVVLGGTTIGTYTNGGGTLAITFNANATGALVNSAMQRIAYSNTAEFAHNQPPSYVQIDWTFSDGNTGAQGSGGTQQCSGSTSVKITGANDAPAGTNNTVTTNEDTAYTFTTADFGFTDVDGNTLTAVKISTLPSAGSLTLNGVAVTAGQTISAANITSSLLVFTPAANANGAGYTSFTFQVQDNGGTANGGVDLDPTPNTMTINVTAVNDAPVITPIAPDPTFIEGGLPQLIDATGTITDADSTDFDGGTLIVSITANGSADDRLMVGNWGTGPGQVGVSGSNVTYEGTVIGTVSGGTGGDALFVSFNAGASAAAVQEVYRSIQFDNLSDAPSTATREIYIELSDGDGGSADPRIKLVYVQAVNDAPVITTVAPDVTFVEGGMPQVIDALGTVSDVDSPDFDGGVLTVSITQNASAADRLLVGNFGTGAGQVGVAGSNVTYGGVVIGTFSGGSSGADPLVVTFNSSATLAAVQEVRASIQFDNVSDTPSTLTRQITFALTDGDGGTATPQNKLVYVQASNDAPVITSDGGGATVSVNVAENQTAVTTVTSTDVDGGAPTYSIVGGADAALFSIDASTGVLTFNAAPNYEAPADAGADNVYDVTVQASDGTLTDTQAIAVTVTNANESPVLNSALLTVSEGQTVSLSGVNFGVTDPDSASFTYTLSGVTGGFFQLSTAAGVPITSFSSTDLDGGLVQFVDDGNEAAPAFSVKVNDGALDSNTLAASVTYTPVNDAPLAVDDVVSGNEDNAITGNVLTNDADVEGNSLTASLVTGPAHGSLALNADGTFSYTPDANWNGTDSFTYKANDGALDSNVATVSITVNPVNDAPVNTLDDSGATLPEDTAVQLLNAVAIADVDGGSGSYTITLSVTPAAGTLSAASGGGVTASGSGTATLTLTGTLASINAYFAAPATAPFYVPVADYNGPVSVTLVTNDNGNMGSGGALTDSDTVNGTISPVADIADDSVTTNEDTPVTFAPLGNDSFENAGRAITHINGAAIASGGSVAVTGGNVTLNADGTLTYAPATDYSGTPAFTYTVTSGGTTETATVSVTVNPVNDTPETVDVSATGVEDASAIAITLSATDIDGSISEFRLANLPANGTLYLDAALTTAVASFTGYAATANTLTLYFKPDANWNGITSFSYTSIDNLGTPDLSTNLATITVTPVNDAPTTTPVTLTPIAEDSGGRLITQAELLANANDVDGPALSATNLAISTGSGTLTDNGNGTWTYTPAANDDTAVSFSYTVTDGSLTAAGTASLDISPVNDAPVAADDSTTGNEDNAISGNVLANDSDVDNASLTASLVTGPAHGTLVLNADGSFTYTPDADWYGSDSFTYTANDSTDDSNVATVTITVNPVNDAPVASNDSVSDNEDTAIAGNVLANDADVDSVSLTATLVSGPGNGSLVFNADGSFTYTPNANFNGSDSFTYTANDGSLDSNVATVTITVNPVNDAPATTPVTLAPIAEDSGARLITQAELLANATDIDGPALTASSLAIASGSGTLVDNGNGTWTYTPAADDDTSVSFSYTVTDGSLTAAGSASLDITPVNDAPTVASPIADQAATEDTAFSFTFNAATLNDVDAGDTLNYTASGLPAWLSFDAATRTFSGTPANTDIGTVTVTVRATDTGGLWVEDQFDVVVGNVNDAPIIVSNVLNIIEGETVILSNSNLQTIDEEQSPTQLTYTISNITHGQFEWAAVPGTAIANFTQADIDAGLVVFVHDASDLAPSYDVSVSDGTTSVGPQAAVINFTPVDEGINVTSLSGTNTTEAGGMVTFDVTLNSQPFADVTVFIVSGNVAEGTVSVSSLTFTAANWSVAQQVSVIGENEFIDDGDQAYVIELQPAVSADRNYDALDAGDVALTNQDNDTAGITMAPTTGLVTDESGASDTFSVVLTSQPLANVVIDLSSSNTDEGTLSASSLTFTSGNWNIPQLVTVTGVNDAPNDGDIAYQAIAAPAASADSNYNGLAAGAVDVTNLDVAEPVAVVPPVETAPPEPEPQPQPDDEAGAPESPADEQIDATPATEGDDPGQPLVETAGTGEFARTNPVEAALNNGLKTSAQLLVNNETPRREVLTHPETQGGILLRVLEILQVEHTLADGNSHSLGSAIKVEITQDDNFQVEILSQGAQITAVSLSVGAVWWALRAGGLFTSLLTSLPAWRSFDVLPVLSRDEDDDDASWKFGHEPEDDDKNDDTRMPELTP